MQRLLYEIYPPGMELTFKQHAFGDRECAWEYQKLLKSGDELCDFDFSKV